MQPQTPRQDLSKEPLTLHLSPRELQVLHPKSQVAREAAGASVQEGSDAPVLLGVVVAGVTFEAQTVRTLPEECVEVRFILDRMGVIERPDGAGMERVFVRGAASGYGGEFGLCKIVRKMSDGGLVIG